MPEVFPACHIILARPVHKYKTLCQSIREESASDRLNILISYFYRKISVRYKYTFDNLATDYFFRQSAACG